MGRWKDSGLGCPVRRYSPIQPRKAVLLRACTACPWLRPWRVLFVSLPILSPGLEAQLKRSQLRPGAAEEKPAYARGSSSQP